MFFSQLPTQILKTLNAKKKFLIGEISCNNLLKIFQKKYTLLSVKCGIRWKHILIKPSQDYIPNEVDYAFLGAWNFLKEIKKKEIKFLKRGGKFITHVPKIKIISF